MGQEMYLIALLGICTLLGGSYCGICPEVSSSCQSLETWVCWSKEWARNMEEWKLQMESKACGGGASPGHSSTPGPNITVRLTIYTSENAETPAANVTIVSSTGSFLIDVLEQAQDHGAITFQYDLQKYGVYITSMEGVAAGNREYWALLDSTGSFLPLGASCYKLDDDQEIVFRIKTW